MAQMRQFLCLFLVFLTACTFAPLTNPVPTEKPLGNTITTIPPTITQTITSTSTIFPTATFTPSPTLTLTPKPTPLGGGGMLVLTLNKRLYTSKFNLPGESNLFLAQSDGSQLTPITQGKDNIANSLADVSQDGKWILYTAIPGDPGKSYLDSYRGDLYIQGLDGSAPIQLNDKSTTVYYDASRFLPDGRVVFIGVGPKGKALYIVNADGSGLSALNDTTGGVPGIARILFFSPDASGVYWVTGGRCNSRGICNETYFYTKIDGSSHHQIWKNVQAAAADISLSPDGSMIAYESFYGGDAVSRQKNDCFVAKADGSEIQKVAIFDCFFLGNNFYRHQVSWSPDGKYIIYRSALATGLKLYSISDGQTKNLSDIGVEDCDGVIWLPGGERLLFNGCTMSPFQLVDLDKSSVTSIPGGRSCDIQLSPDGTEVWFYNCGDNPVSQSYYSILNLQTLQVHPILNDLQSSDESVGWYVIFTQPSRWIISVPGSGSKR
ncbi:MAG: hypothetical protein P4L50_27670 [Anaerolineaceae bacterium]|nr:hypothetical protein [Anaerolineaceae bacterium]